MTPPGKVLLGLGGMVKGGSRQASVRGYLEVELPARTTGKRNALWKL